MTRFERAIDWLGGDEALFASLAQDAATSFEASARKLSSLASEGTSLADLAAEAHHVKSVWKPYATADDEALPVDLERAARAGDRASATALAQRLAQALSSAARDLNGYLASRKGKTG